MKKKILFLCILMSALMSYNVRAQVSFWANTPSGHSLHFWHWDDCDTCITVEIGPANNLWDTAESSYLNLTGALIIPETVSSNGRTYTVGSISYGCFSNCVGLTSVSIPSSMNYINAAVFRGCTGLTNVSIPNSVREIGYDAFKNCTALTSITIPTSTEEICGNAFAGCIGLYSITIPFSVKRMKYGVFRNCTGLTSINFNADSCLMCYNNGQSYFENVFEGCMNITNINIGDNVRYISPHAFSGCTRVETITIGKNVESIYENSFENTLNSLTTINYNAINYSGSFYPFIGRSSITTVNIGDEVTVIPHLAFKDCTGLRTVTIGSAVDNIKNRAFYGCDHLISITCRAEYPPICQEETFTSVPRYADVIVPCGTAYRYQASNYWNEFTRIIEDCDDIDDVEDLPNIKINVIDGCIVVDGAESNTVWLYDVNGRILATKQDEYSPLHFDVPSSGAYMVKIGNHPARKVVVIR